MADRIERLDITYVPMELIRPNPFNPNRQTPTEFAMLKESMIADGFTQPVLVRKLQEADDNGCQYEVVDGEHRWRCCQDPDVAEAIGVARNGGIACVIVEMSQLQQMISMQRHNRARGSDDIDALAQLVQDVKGMGEEAMQAFQEGAGMGDEEIARLLALGDDMLEDLAGEQPGEGWQYVPTQGTEGDNHEWEWDGGAPNSKSGAKQTVTPEVKAAGSRPLPKSPVPGLGARDETVRASYLTLPRMERRMYVMDAKQAADVDYALREETIDGEEYSGGAHKLVLVCREYLKSRGIPLPSDALEEATAEA